MRGLLTIIPVSGAVSSQELTAPPALRDLKAGIGGGYIEAVHYFTSYQGEPCVAFCDEDGKRKQMPVNTHASTLWFLQQADRGVIQHDRLVGPVVIVTGAEIIKAMQSDEDIDDEEA